MGEDSKPAITTDVAVVAAVADKNADKPAVLLIKRANEPFSGRWALPGGFLDPGERLEECARRELHEETGLEVDALEQLGVYDTPGRDPRGWIMSVVYLALVPDERPARGADDAAEAQWFPLDELPPLAFDHDQVLADVRERVG